MGIPIRYNLLSLRRRRISTIMTAAGIALVVAVFVVTMSLSDGIRVSLSATGMPLNINVMRQGSTAETTSFISRHAFSVIRCLDGIVAMDRSVAAQRSGLRADRFPEKTVSLAAAETLLLINIPKKGQSVGSNVMIRGVQPASFLVHPEIKIVAGRCFDPGLREVIVSRQLANRYQNCEIGNRLKFGRDYWTIVGHFTAGNSAFNSEFWGDAFELGNDFDRQQFSSVTIRATDNTAATWLMKRISSDPQLNLKAQPELEYYKQQTMAAIPIQVLGTFLAFVMAIGACFAAMNAMYAAISARVKEIGTLRVLGFQPRDILWSFVAESLLIATLGGLLGCALVLPLNNVSTGTANWKTFSELTFKFTISSRLLIEGLFFSLVMGFLGGFLPARNASRKSIIGTLKEL